MVLFDWTEKEKWRHIKHFMDTHTYSESNLEYLKSWVEFMLGCSVNPELSPKNHTPVHESETDCSQNAICPNCGNSKHYRIIYTDDEKTEVKFYDCMICHTHWDKDV